MKNLLLLLTVYITAISYCVAQEGSQVWGIDVDKTGNAIFGEVCSECAITPIRKTTKCVVVKSPCPNNNSQDSSSFTYGQPISVGDWKVKVVPNTPEAGSGALQNAWTLEFKGSSNVDLFLANPPKTWTTSRIGIGTVQFDGSTSNQFKTSVVRMSAAVNELTPIINRPSACLVKVPCQLKK